MQGNTRWRGTPYTNLQRFRLGALTKELFTGLLVFDVRFEIYGKVNAGFGNRSRVPYSLHSQVSYSSLCRPRSYCGCRTGVA